MKNEIIIKQNVINGLLIALRSWANEKIATNSLSLFNLIKQKSKPKISMKGIITVIKFGIKYIESKKISNTSICKKFVTVKSLVICNNHATDKKMNKIRIKYFEICKNK